MYSNASNHYPPFLTKRITFMNKFLHWLIPVCFIFLSVSLVAQFEWARVGIHCPCTLESEDGKTATVKLGVQNFEGAETDKLYVTIAMTGHFDDPNLHRRGTVLLGTTSLDKALPGFSRLRADEYEVELGELPKGRVFLEIVLHEGPRLDSSPVLDFVWFEGEIESPFTSISKVDMNFLIDTDHDGVDDVNERFMGTDPDDATSTPETPIIDVAVLYDRRIRDRYTSGDARHVASHVFNATNFFFQNSGVDKQYRIVGFRDDAEIPEILQGFFLPGPQRQSVQEEFGADLIVVFHPPSGGLGGIAEDIGGWRGRGFIHERSRAILTHVYLNPALFPINVTAHEIGHLIGLGHSYLQGAIGTYYWSRGHGINNRFGTIMTYAWLYRAIDIDKFSNPDLDCNGEPCGISQELTNHERSANSVLSSNVTRFQVASTGTPPAGFDFDGDGVDAVNDVFPVDPNEWADSDGDGWGDNSDLFPNDPTEWADFDSDGIGNNQDPDIDNDGVDNLYDHDPFDPTVQMIHLRRVVSPDKSAMFGYAVTLINDVSGDGEADLAVAAPHFDSSTHGNVGQISLFSVSGNAWDEMFIHDGKPLSTVNLDVIQSLDSTWVIHGTAEQDELGLYMDYLPATEEGYADHLVVSYRNSFVLIQSDHSSLQAFDQLDGTSDRNIHIEHCNQSDSCWFIGDNPNLKLHGIVEIAERDYDGMSDLAVLGSRHNGNDLSLYLLTTKGIKSFNEATATTNALDTLIANVPFCFRVDIGELQDNAAVFNLGSVTGDIYPAIGVSFERTRFTGPSSIMDGGSLYVLNTHLVAIWDIVDAAQDGVVEVSNLLQPGYGSYKFSSDFVQAFGEVVHPTPDIDADGRDEIMIWNGDTNRHYVVGSSSLDTVDVADGNVDSTGRLNTDSANIDNIWVYTAFPLRSKHAAGILQSDTNGQNSYSFNHATFSQGVTFSLNDIVNHDNIEPSRRDGNFSVNDTLSAADTNVYNAIIGLRATSMITGITSLNDLDGDNQVDFIFAHHVEEDDYYLHSGLNFLYTASFNAIDKTDGVVNNFLALHNNLDDTDADGILNLKDEDDDNDGALDSYDGYPVHAIAIYDRDGDRIADAIDAFPTSAAYSEDTDRDGIPDEVDPDLDGDGIDNYLDEFPEDSDNDGIVNRFDPDDDNDGVTDTEDAFPLNPNEQYDTDGDGYGDNQDAFANDATEWLDSDGDGIGNNTDTDDDNDGYADVNDRYPLNALEWADSDGDGLGDNADPFPNNRFEWSDENDDGIGDNFAGANIESYRIESEWHPISRSPQSIQPLTLFGFNKPNELSLLIVSGSPGSPRDSHYLFAKSDISDLDEADDTRDHTIKINHIAESSIGWELRNFYGNNPPYFRSGSTSNGQNSDSVKNLLVQTPIANGFTGVVNILVGDKLTEADVSDGIKDRKINYAGCSDYNECISIHNDLGQWVFGWSATSLHGLLVENESSLILTNYYATPQGTAPNESVPLILIIPMSVLHDLSSEMGEGRLALSDVLNVEGVYQVFAETSANSDSWASTVKQIPDLDQDGADELLLSVPLIGYTYVITSSDVRAVLNDPALAQEQLSISHFRAKPNSYRLTGTPTFDEGHFGFSDVSTRLIPFNHPSSSESVFAVDLTELAMHDKNDGTEDAIVESFDIENTKAWRIDGVTEGTICYGNGENSQPSFLGAYSTWLSNEVRYASFDALETQLGTGTTEKAVNIVSAIQSRQPGAYVIAASSEQGLFNWEVAESCVWDWNDDGEADITISQTLLTNDFDSGIGYVNLVMSSDLAALDLRDGIKDNRVNVTALWEKAPDPEEDEY